MSLPAITVHPVGAASLMVLPFPLCTTCISIKSPTTNPEGLVMVRVDVVVVLVWVFTCEICADKLLPAAKIKITEIRKMYLFFMIWCFFSYFIPI